MGSSELRAALFGARTAAVVIAALVRIHWHDTHNGATCPDDAIPTEANLTDWLSAGEYPDTVHDESERSLSALLWPSAEPLIRERTTEFQEWWDGSITFQVSPDDVRWSWYVHMFGTDRMLVASVTGTETLFEILGARVWPLDQVHCLWVELSKTQRSRHPLAPVIAAWQARARPAVPFVPKKRASLPRIHRITEDKAARLLGFPNCDAPDPAQLDLPGFGPVLSGCPSWLLWMFDAAGGESMAQGRGAPWPMRLFIGALLNLGVRDRDGQWKVLRFPTEDVIAWLHPNGWANRRRDWEHFPAAFDAMRDRLAYVPVGGVGSVALMFPSVIPREPSDPFVEFTIRIPPAAANGARICWPRLCQYGTKSAVLYRAYLSACAFLDQSAHRGHAITAELGAPILLPNGRPKRRKGGGIERSTHDTVPNPAARYVAPLIDSDLAGMIGFDTSDRRYRHLAREAFERLCADGVIDLRREDRGLYLFGPRSGTE